jgi:hypothetical protein
VLDPGRGDFEDEKENDDEEEEGKGVLAAWAAREAAT